MRKALLLLLCLAAFTCVHAQDVVASCDNETFRHIMDDLVSKGNLCYETSDRFGIKRMMDSISTCLRQRSRNGKLDKMDSLEYTADWYKLQGSYHYENSYYDSTSYMKAHENYQKALKIYRSDSAFEGDLSCEPMIHRELAQLYYKEANYQEAYNHTKMAYDAFVNAADGDVIGYDDSDFLDIQTQMAICQARMGKTTEALAIMDKQIKSYPAKDERYGEALRKKGKILMLREEQGGRKGKNEALNCYQQYFSLKKADALQHFMGMPSAEREQYWMRVRPFVIDCYRLEDADAGFLYNVTLFAKGLLLQLDSAGGGKQNIHATWQMIQERLKPDACAIEFVQYEKYGKQQMGALVLKKTGEPKFVNMASPDSVLQHIVGGRSVKSRLEGTGKGNFIAIDRVYDDSTGVFRLIWNDELLAAVGIEKKVYFSPDGYMHRIAIEYMLPKEVSSWEMYRLSSTRKLLELPPSVTGSKALIVGAVNYSAKNSYVDGDNDIMAYKMMPRGRYENLKTSRQEIDSIYSYRHHTSDVLLSGDDAAEHEFRRQCCEFPIVHISSHGKLNAKEIPFGTDLKSFSSDLSLSESVIAFAGLNTSLSDDAFNPARQQDGILSAKEISSLDMRNVQLVTLACCESGLGQVTAEGVYGIQRGLKNAGVGAIVMTLWEADDDNTTLFMKGFYRRLSKGKTIGQAFQETRQEDFLSADDDNINRSCYRNVFVLVDALE